MKAIWCHSKINTEAKNFRINLMNIFHKRNIVRQGVLETFW